MGVNTIWKTYRHETKQIAKIIIAPRKYLNIEEDRVVAFASVCRNLIKNVYATKDSYLVELLQYLKKEVKIRPSTVTNIYRETYEKAGYQIMTDEAYKNFVKIS